MEKTVLLYSPRLREILKTIDSDISLKLLNREGSSIRWGISYIDVDDIVSGNLTFSKWETSIAKIKSKHTHWEGPYGIDVSDYLWRNRFYSDVADVYISGRSSIKLGKFINKIIDKSSYTQSELEIYINKFKSIVNRDKGTFEIVSGLDIEKWYDSKNYHRIRKWRYEEPNSSLHNSCMTDKKGIFKIYTDNPDSCKLLIYKTKDNKLLGRALLWKLDTIDYCGNKLYAEYYMDRVYFVEDNYAHTFYNFCKNKNFIYKDFLDRNRFKYRGVSYFDVKMSIKLKRKEYSKYPYLDTFYRYNSTNGIIYNFKEHGHVLRSTSGGYERGISFIRIFLNKIRNFVIK
jgi:hypothetical protein